MHPSILPSELGGLSAVSEVMAAPAPASREPAGPRPASPSLAAPGGTAQPLGSSPPSPPGSSSRPVPNFGSIRAVSHREPPAWDLMPDLAWVSEGHPSLHEMRSARSQPACASVPAPRQDAAPAGAPRGSPQGERLGAPRSTHQHPPPPPPLLVTSVPAASAGAPARPPAVARAPPGSPRGGPPPTVLRAEDLFAAPEQQQPPDAGPGAAPAPDAARWSPHAEGRSPGQGARATPGGRACPMPAAGRREPPEAESQAGPKRRCPPDEARFSWEPRRGSVPARGGSAAGSMRSPQGHRGGSWAAPWSGTREHRPAAPPTVPSSAERPTAHGRQIDPRVDLWGAALDLPSRPQGQALSPAYEERHTCSAEHIFRHARTAPPRQPPDHAPGAVAAPGAAVGSAGPRASAGRPSSQGQRGARGIRACPMPSAEPGTAASSTYVDLVLADWEVELVKHMRAVSFLDSVVRTHGLERDVEQIAAARQRHESEEERIIRVTYEGLRSEEMAKRFMEAERQRDDQEERHETSVPETSVPAGQQEAADPPRAAPAPMPCVVPGAGGAAPERLPEARQVPTPELSLGREQANHPGSGFPNPGEKSAGAEGDRGPNADMF